MDRYVAKGNADAQRTRSDDEKEKDEDEDDDEDEDESSDDDFVFDAWEQYDRNPESNTSFSSYEGFRQSSTAFRKDDLDFETVIREEKQLIETKLSYRRWEGSDHDGGKQFSLAFSGGGVRAAAFQSGVLWRLAEKNMIKDIDYFSAVSGGGYITSAVVSHIIQKERQEGRPDVQNTREWYLDAVCSTILRMQRNAGDFVRDSVKQPGIPKDGAGRCPRIFDLPLLIIMITITVCVNPVTFVVLVVVPLTVATELYFGAAMRAAFCAPSGSDWIEIFWMYSPFQYILLLLPCSVAATFSVWVVTKTCCHRSRLAPSGSLKTHWYLCGQSCTACLSRFSVIIFLCILILFLIPWLQILSNGLGGCEIRKMQCVSYINKSVDPERDPDSWSSSSMREAWLQNTTFQDILNAFSDIDGRNYTVGIPDSCADITNGSLPWFEQAPFNNLSLDESFCYGGDDQHVEFKATGTLRLIDAPARAVYEQLLKDNQSVLSWLLAVIGIALLASLCAMPFLGSGMLSSIAWSSGPLLLFLILLVFIQYRVFGPVTGQRFLGCVPWDPRLWKVFVTKSFVLSLLIPLYQELRSVWHRYYRTSLQVNFFAEGEDKVFSQVKESVCSPFVLLTGTANDFKKCGEKGPSSTICEISFSSLHMGSKKTGYCRTPRWESLGKITALSGAGCLDAISLSMNGDTRKFRFWLEVLNLSWGDYILFGNCATSHVWKCCERVGRKLRHRDALWERVFMHFAHRLTPAFLLLVHYGLINLAWFLKRKDEHDSCQWARSITLVALVFMLGLLSLSFFAFVPCLAWTMFDPWLRQIQQAVMHPFEGEKPPGLLYITDGGVEDCTTLVQLMKRKSERILLVLAAADPNDEFGVLRTAMAMALKEKIGSFFDPQDPRRDVNILFDEFKHSSQKTWMHVGIRYGWEGVGDAKLGHLVIVKNRLPEQFQNQQCQPPLTEEEIKYGESERRWDADEALGMMTDELGPWGCCDCCHTAGLNCGPKFPHGNFAGYLYLSPAWFNGLCRLGWDLSEEAVDAISKLSFESCRER